MSVNAQEEIKNLIGVLLDPQKSEKDYITALGDLIDYVDNLDFANGTYSFFTWYYVYTGRHTHSTMYILL